MKNYRGLFSCLLLIWTFGTQAQYQLVWEEQFEGTSLNTDVWNYETGVGVWNTGANAELQHYRAENVAVGPDGEGNSALIITARRENFNAYAFTSGRIQTRGKVGVKYGKIEARIKLPVLENGLWPAFWMLGTQNGWPASGEIDILEAGHAEGIANSQQERTLNGALHWQHEGNYAGYGPQWTAPEGTNLYDYNTFTLSWTPTTIQMFLNDMEEPYFKMNITGADAEEFRDWPHYFVINLAVGGSFPGITNPAAITAPFPAQMFVDYIKVYQREDEGELVVSPPVTPPVTPPAGETYGIYTENPNVDTSLLIDDLNGHIYIWENTLGALSSAPYDGEEVLAFASQGSAGWWGFGVHDDAAADLSHFADGYLHFAVKTTSAESFRIEISGANGTKGHLGFVAGSDPSGFVRDGAWHQVSFPLAPLVAGGLDLSAVPIPFSVTQAGSSTSITDLAFDDIVYSVHAEAPHNPNLYQGGDEEEPEAPRWDLWTGDGGVAQVTYGGEQEAAVTVIEAGWADHSVQLFIDDLALPDGDYVLTFKAKALAARNINVNVGKGLDVDPWFVAFMEQETFALTSQWQSFTHTFTKNNAYNDGKLVFELGNVAGSGSLLTTVQLDEVQLVPAVSTALTESEVKAPRLLSNPAREVLEVVAVPQQLIQLYSVGGQLLRSVVAAPGVTGIAVGELPRGLYILKVQGTALKVVLN